MITDAGYALITSTLKSLTMTTPRELDPEKDDVVKLLKSAIYLNENYGLLIPPDVSPHILTDQVIFLTEQTNGGVYLTLQKPSSPKLQAAKTAISALSDEERKLLLLELSA